MGRPDFSDYVAHFTKDEGVEEDLEISKLPAIDRLKSILDDQHIRETAMPWTGARCASFTECPWGSLIAHADNFSPYAIGFHKDSLWGSGGGPAIYLRPNLYQAQMSYVETMTDGASSRGFARELWPFITPISRRPFQLIDGREIPTAVDYSHEREWRVPGGFHFEYEEVAFLIVRVLDDLDSFPERAVKAIGTDRVLSMDNYRHIKEFWPDSA